MGSAFSASGLPINPTVINRPLLTVGFQEKNYSSLVFHHIVSPFQLCDVYKKASMCIVKFGWLTLENSRNSGRDFTPLKTIELYNNNSIRLRCIFEDYRNLHQSYPMRNEREEREYDIRCDRYTSKGRYRWDPPNQLNPNFLKIDQILTQEFLDRYLLPSIDLINFRASQKLVERYYLLRQNPYSPVSSWFW